MTSDTTPHSKPTTSTSYQVISALLSFFIWGGWAWFVNAQAQTPESTAPIISGLLQGTGSCLTTLFMMQSVTWLFQRLITHPLRPLLPSLITTSFTGTCFFILHTMVKTADPLLTIIPGVVVAFCFNMYTTFRLRQRLLGAQELAGKS